MGRNQSVKEWVSESKEYIQHEYTYKYTLTTLAKAKAKVNKYENKYIPKRN